MKFSLKPNCHKRSIGDKTEMSKKKMSLKWNVTKTEMWLWLIYNHDWNVIKTVKSEIFLTSLKLKCHKNWNVMKTKMSLKMKCILGWNV